MIARLSSTVVLGAFFFAATASAVFAQQATPLQTPSAVQAPTSTEGQSPTQGQTPKPKARYTLPDALSAHAYPAATATPGPNSVTVSGRFRAYNFDRVNHVQESATKGAAAANPDRYVTNFGIEPHLDYRIGNTNLNLGYSYQGADPFGLNPVGKGGNPATNPQIDNTLGGFRLDSPIHELYVQYKDPTTLVTVGNQELNYFWAPASDSRIQPASYQAFDTAFHLDKTLTFGLTDIVRFQARNSSNFEPNTLLTANYDGASVLSKYTAVGAQTPGTLRTALTYKPVSNFSLTGEEYQFYDIANLSYGELKYGFAPKAASNPYFAAQYVNEVSTGQQQVGKIYNTTYGAQLGANVGKGLLFTVSADVAPWRYAYVSSAAAESTYFLPSGGSGAAEKVGTNLYKVAYGGIASPYTDSYASDPLYTTMLTQGAIDRRSAGQSYKTALVYTTPNKQFKFIAAAGYFNYNNAIPVAASTSTTANPELLKSIYAAEYNLDGTYYVSKVKSGQPYHGLFARIRFAPRQVPVLPYSFQYQRFQLEYDF